jgi:hypothetical protein
MQIVPGSARNKTAIQDMILPNFLMIGAAKSGTSAIYRQLRHHPDVFMSHIKEPSFFALQGHDLHFAGPGDMDALGACAVNNLDEYSRLFEAGRGAAVVGEASNIYLYSPAAPRAIKEMLPNVKMIAVLRDPVERAFSAYLMMLRDGRESLPLDQALEQAEDRAEKGWTYFWQYQRLGLYAKQLKRYFELFPREQILTLLYDDFLINPADFMDRVCTFLGVEPWTFSNIKANVSRDPTKWRTVRSSLLRDVMNVDSGLKRVVRKAVPRRMFNRTGAAIRRMNMAVPRLDAPTREKLVAYYQEDMAELERLTGHDLTRWRRR